MSYGFLSHFPAFGLRPVLTGPDLTDQPRLTNKSEGVSCLGHPRAGVTDIHYHTWLFTRALKSELRFFCLHGEHYPNLGHLFSCHL